MCEKMGIIILLSALLPSSFLQAQEVIFSYDADKTKVGTVYHYEKSNIDGSNKGNISLYVASPTRLESLKWHTGNTTASLVTAEMDWKTFSVRRFESWRIGEAGEKSLVAVLEAIEGKPQVVVHFGENEPDTVTIAHYPWHSYDFDFASLNVTFRHLVNPEKPFEIGIVDVIYEDDGARFGNKGTVKVVYSGEELRHNVVCRKYLIDGPGLENRGGVIWVTKSGNYIIDYEIDLPDERSYESGKLTLRKIEKISPEQWQGLIKNRDN